MTTELTPRQNDKIRKFILDTVTTELENALHGSTWQDLMEKLQEVCDPTDIFGDEELGEWAIANGYVKAVNVPIIHSTTERMQLSELAAEREISEER
jgi:hypothetical protein